MRERSKVLRPSRRSKESVAQGGSLTTGMEVVVVGFGVSAE